MAAFPFPLPASGSCRVTRNIIDDKANEIRNNVRTSVVTNPKASNLTKVQKEAEKKRFKDCETTAKKQLSDHLDVMLKYYQSTTGLPPEKTTPLSQENGKANDTSKREALAILEFYSLGPERAKPSFHDKSGIPVRRVDSYQAEGKTIISAALGQGDFLFKTLQNDTISLDIKSVGPMHLPQLTQGTEPATSAKIQRELESSVNLIEEKLKCPHTGSNKGDGFIVVDTSMLSDQEHQHFWQRVQNQIGQDAWRIYEVSSQLYPGQKVQYTRSDLKPPSTSSPPQNHPAPEDNFDLSPISEEHNDNS